MTDPAVSALRAAELRARELFAEAVCRELIVPGTSEHQLSTALFELAQELFGVRRYWHKRIVRAGRNTLLPYSANPPDLVIAVDDVVIVDFGPVFEDWEADLGQTFVLGSDPDKHRLVAEVAAAWEAGAALFRVTPDLTAAQLFAFMADLAQRGGWAYGDTHCGHLVGRFPHEKIDGDEPTRYLRADNHTRLREQGAEGPLRWILEAHFIAPALGFGAFQESMLFEADER